MFVLLVVCRIFLFYLCRCLNVISVTGSLTPCRKTRSMAGPPLSVSVGTSSGDEKLLISTSQDFPWELDKIPRMYLHGKNISVHGNNTSKHHRLCFFFFKKVYLKVK